MIEAIKVGGMTTSTEFVLVYLLVHILVVLVLSRIIELTRCIFDSRGFVSFHIVIKLIEVTTLNIDIRIAELKHLVNLSLSLSSTCLLICQLLLSTRLLIEVEEIIFFIKVREFTELTIINLTVVIIIVRHLFVIFSID